MIRMVSMLVLASLTACNPAPATLTEADLASIRQVSFDFTKHVVAGDWTRF